MNSPHPEMTFDDLLVLYNEAHATSSPNTAKQYGVVVRHVNRVLGRPATLADATEGFLANYHRQRRQVEMMAAATVESEISKLLALIRWAAERGWCDRPLYEHRKTKGAAPRSWTWEQVLHLIYISENYVNLDDTPPTFARLPGTLVMPAMLRLLLDTGERHGAACQLKWSDIRGRWVTFRAETRKGGDKAGDNLQRIGRKTAKAIGALRNVSNDTELVFPEVDVSVWYKHMHRVLAQAGLPGDRRCMFHMLRRTHATYVHLAGGDATTALGHSSDAVTRKHYLDPTICGRVYGADLLNGLWGRLMLRWQRLWHVIQLRS